LTCWCHLNVFLVRRGIMKQLVRYILDLQ